MVNRRIVQLSSACLAAVVMHISLIGNRAVAADVPVVAPIGAPASVKLIRSAQSGPWSKTGTWEGGQVPAAGESVLIRPGHVVVYDVALDVAIRAVHIGGKLSFAPGQDTRLVVGLIKISGGEDVSEDGFECDAHGGDGGGVLEVGTAGRPIEAAHTALIRLAYVEGTDKLSWPAIVCCGGRMDFHGAVMNRTWCKLGATAKAGDGRVILEEAVAGWRVGDRVIVTATKGTLATSGTRRPSARTQKVYTEERVVRGVDGATVELDRPLEFEHLGAGEYRGEVANLTRNVVVESADPAGNRGHTMYHHGSGGSIGYAEFRHLGKENVLGRYALHFHKVGDTMRGSSVIGASIWDRLNWWVTIHGTNHLVVRDCVGYQSVGHGFFMEDGTEVYNVLDRNLAVQAYEGKKLKDQLLSFDQNEGAGFWWANSLNTFTRNVACENDRYGFRFEATPTSEFKPTLSIEQPDGSRAMKDIRTLPFVRFAFNEAHCDGEYGFNLGEGAKRVGPDMNHPFVIRNMKIWQVHYGFRPEVPSVLVEHLRLNFAEYGVYNPDYDHHVYRDVYVGHADAEPFNRGLDDLSKQYGPLLVEGLRFEGKSSRTGMWIQISDDNPTGTATSYFSDVKVIGEGGRAVVNRGEGPRPEPTTARGVPVYFFDYYGPGRHAMIVSTRSPEYIKDPERFHAEPPLTGDESRVAEAHDVEAPKLLDPVDDLPPTTVVTSVVRRDGKVVVRGTSADNGEVTKVLVNGREARLAADGFGEWEAVVDGDVKRVEAHAVDAAGNVERVGKGVGVGE